MRILFYLSLQFLISTSVFAQSELCEHTTNGEVNSNNLKIKLFTPCDWEKATSNQENVVFNYDYKATGLVRLSLIITKLPATISDVEIKSHFTLDGLKTIGNASGTFVSSKILIVDNVKGGEVIRRTISKKNGTDFYFYVIQNFFVLNRNLVCIQYSFGALKDSFLLEYSNYLKMFHSLIAKTKFN